MRLKLLFQISLLVLLVFALTPNVSARGGGRGGGGRGNDRAGGGNDRGGDRAKRDSRKKDSDRRRDVRRDDRQKDGAQQRDRCRHRVRKACRRDALSDLSDRCRAHYAE